MLDKIFLLGVSAETAVPAAPAAGAADAAGSPSTAPLAMETIFQFLPFVILIGIFYLFFIRPEQKRSKETRQMLDNMQVADEIVTTGGIVGRVLAVQQDTVLIETGGDKTRLRVLRTAIAENRTAKAKVEELRKEQAAQRRKPQLTNIAEEKSKKGKSENIDKKDAKEDRFDKGKNK